MATWEDIQDYIQAIADARDSISAYSLRTPAEAIEVDRNIEIKPGEAWGEDRPFQIYLEGLGAYFDNEGWSQVSDIRTKLNELIASHNQLLYDYNNNVWPSTASTVSTLP